MISPLQHMTTTVVRQPIRPAFLRLAKLALSMGKVEMQVCKSLYERDEQQDAAWRAITR